MQTKNHNEPHAQREKTENLTQKESSQGLGWLKNGNPAGDFKQAPRCNACSKRTGEPCRQPAMANGKCRLHGGLSSGPKTPAGLARSQKANWKHGFYSEEARQERKDIAVFLKNAKTILRDFKSK